MRSVNEIHAAWRALPIGSLEDVTGGGTCLILAPHPDDESLGCGGLIAAACAASLPPVVAILTDGSASHPASRRYPPARLRQVREAESMRAVAILGLPADRLIFLREADGRAPNHGPAFDSVVRRLQECAHQFACTRVLAPWRYDPHCDHQAAARIAAAAALRTGALLVEYPVWGWTLPDDTRVIDPGAHGWRLDITAHLTAKRSAVAAHASQYGGLIDDDPSGFRLPKTLLSAMDAPWETFLRS